MMEFYILQAKNEKENIAKILAIPFDKDIHYSIAYIHLYYAMLEPAAELLAIRMMKLISN